MSEDTVIRHGRPHPGGDENGEPLPLLLLLPPGFGGGAAGHEPGAGAPGAAAGPLRREKGRALLYLFRPARPCPGTWPRRRSAACSARRATGTWARGPAWRNSAAAWGPAGIFPMRSASSWAIPRGRGGLCPPPGQGVQVRGLLEGLRGRGRRPAGQFAAFKACTANYCRRRAKGASLARLAVTTRLPQ